MAGCDGKRILGRIRKACVWGALQLAVWPGAVVAALEPGAVAPAFSLPSLATPAERVALADHGGKVLYIDFWSAWCAPCRDAMPALAALREAYPRERFEVIGINVDPVPEAARRVLEEVGAHYPTASDASAESATMYGVEALPAAFVVGADGIVRHVQRGPLVKDINVVKAALTALVEPESAQPEEWPEGRDMAGRPEVPKAEVPEMEVAGRPEAEVEVAGRPEAEVEVAGRPEMREVRNAMTSNTFAAPRASAAQGLGAAAP